MSTSVTPARAADAQLALACMMAESAFDPAQPAIIAPPLDARLAGRYALRGHLTAQDAVFRHEIPLGTQRVYYGWLLESIAAPGSFLLVIRGTAGGVEWGEDATGLPVPYGATGAQVHRGFWELYRTFLYTPLGGIAQPALSGVAAAVGKGTVQVVGHSLGAALATYWAYELADPALLEERVVAPRPFESPRPGDGKFADLFGARIKDAIAYWYRPDIVPQVPFGFGYTPLHCVEELDPETARVRIRCNAGCNHHAVNVALVLDPNALKGITLTPREMELYGNCGVDLLAAAA